MSVSRLCGGEEIKPPNIDFLHLGVIRFKIYRDKGIYFFTLEINEFLPYFTLIFIL